MILLRKRLGMSKTPAFSYAIPKKYFIILIKEILLMVKRKITGLFLAVVMIASLFSFGGMSVGADNYSPDPAAIMPSSGFAPFSSTATPTGLRLPPGVSSNITLSIGDMDWPHVDSFPRFAEFPIGWTVEWTSANDSVVEIDWDNTWTIGSQAAIRGLAAGTSAVRAQLRDDAGDAVGAAVTFNVTVLPSPTGITRVGPAAVEAEQGRWSDFLRVALAGSTRLPNAWHIDWTTDDWAVAWVTPSWPPLRANLVAGGGAQIGSQTTITAQLRDNNGNPVGTPVEFTVTITEWTPRISDFTQWCYITETLQVQESGLLYALRFDPTRPERTRWLPLVGSINLGRVFPRAGRNPVTIAFRQAEMYAVAAPGAVGGFTPEAPIMTLTLNARPELARNAVSYTPFAWGGLVMGAAPADAAAARTALLNFGSNYCERFAMMSGRAGVNGWQYMCCESSASALNPFGGNFGIRQIAGGTGATEWYARMEGTTIYPASNSVRIRIPAIPRAPRAPRIATRTPASTIAITDRMEFVVITHEEIGGITEAARAEYFAGLQLGDMHDYFEEARVGTGAMNLVGSGAITRPDGGALQANDVILVRMRATNRAPASFITPVVLTAANLPAQTP